MIKKLSSIIDKSVERLIVVCVILIIFLAIANIVLRWFHFSFSWIDPLVRHLVFFSAFLGGILAIGSNQHIKVDLLQKVINKRKGLKKIMRLLYFVITFSVLAALSYSAIGFTQSELEFGKKTFLNIHSSVLTGIIPFGFVLMTLRQFLLFFEREG